MVASLIVLGFSSIFLYAAGIVSTVVEGCPGRASNDNADIRTIGGRPSETLSPTGIECGPDGETFEANPELRWASIGCGAGFIGLLALVIRRGRSGRNDDGGSGPLGAPPTA